MLFQTVDAVHLLNHVDGVDFDDVATINREAVLGFDLSSLSLNANGGIYQSADLSRYSGTVVNRPTFFAFAKGAGVMGEAGPEAILPLRRGADGKLGVVADIGGSGMAMFAPQYNIEINNDGTNGQIAASINIRPGYDYYFYVRSVNTVGKSAFVEAVGQPSDDASGYLDFFKGEIGKTHLAQELWTQIDNGQLAPDLAEIRTSITDVSNEITQTVNKKLEDQSAAIQQIQKVQVDTNNNLNSMWAVKLQQMQDGRLYIAGIGAGIENTPDGMQSQVLLAADRIAMVNPANGNTKPMFVGQGDQIFMNDVFLKRLTAPTITSGGNPPAFSLTPDGKLTAKNADISGSVNANAGTLNNVTVNENCTIKGMLEATQVRGDFVKAVSKSFPKQAGTWGNTETPNGTVTVTISDDHNFDRQIIIPPIIFNGIAYSDPGSGNNPGGTRYTGYGFEVRKNGVLIASRETKGAIPGSYSAVIDMPSGRGSVTLEFKVFHKGNQRAGNITDCTVIVTKKAASGISIR